MKDLTDRELLEQIYQMLLQILNKLDDNNQFNMNVLANLVGDALMGERR